MLQEILGNYYDEEFITADGLDEAVIGVDDESMRLIYSVRKIIHIFMEEGMEEEEALEYFEYNTVRAGEYMGERRPIWCRDY